MITKTISTKTMTLIFENESEIKFAFDAFDKIDRQQTTSSQDDMIDSIIETVNDLLWKNENEE
jgi:hypothetical protein